MHVSRFGVILKKSQLGKWRLILDLSAPEGASLIDRVSPALSSLGYVSVDDVAAMILALGKGSLLAKPDLKSAYRSIPMHPDDQVLLGMTLEGHTFINTTLPFGLRSAPKIFSALSDVLECVIVQRGGSSTLHYLGRLPLSRSASLSGLPGHSGHGHADLYRVRLPGYLRKG